MITSLSNSQVKEVCALQRSRKARQETGFFVAEGRRLLEEASEDLLVRVYATEAFLEEEESRGRLPERLVRLCEPVSPAVFAKMADTQAPQGILGVLKMPETAPEELPEGPLLILETVQDPGNVGTLVRTAEAAGMAGVLADRLTADPFQPKAVRSAMGSLFRVPLAVTDDLPGELTRLKKAGCRLIAAHLKGQAFYDGIAWPVRCGILLGNEGNGLSDTVSALADELVRIPMAGRTESLNVSAAGAIMMYESFRNRRNS